MEKSFWSTSATSFSHQWFEPVQIFVLSDPFQLRSPGLQSWSENICIFSCTVPDCRAEATHAYSKSKFAIRWLNLAGAKTFSNNSGVPCSSQAYYLFSQVCIKLNSCIFGQWLEHLGFQLHHSFSLNTHFFGKVISQSDMLRHFCTFKPTEEFFPNSCESGYDQTNRSYKEFVNLSRRANHQSQKQCS